MLKIVICDDDAAIRFALGEALSVLPVDVVSVATGQEAIAQAGDADVLITDLVMPEMDGFAVLGAIRKVEPELPVITLSPELERILHQSLQAGGGDGAGIEPGLAERMQRSLVEATQRQELEGQPAVLLTSGILRNTLAKFVKNAIPGLRVLSYQEVPDDKQIRIVSAVGQG